MSTYLQEYRPTCKNARMSTCKWTSNFQIISKVYLEKHPSQSRTYRLNKKDSKMVKSGMAKMVAPEVAEE